MTAWYPVRGLITALVDAAAEATGAKAREITGPCRVPELCEARWAIILVAIRRGAGSSQIGRALNRDHSTIISGHRRARDLIKSRRFARFVARLEAAVPEDEREAA